MNFFKKIIATLRFNEAVRQATKAYKQDGNRYYVMPTTGDKGHLIIMNRYNFRKLKMKKYISQKATVRDLEQKCFYATPYKNGSGELSEQMAKQKKKAYFKWLEEISK